MGSNNEPQNDSDLISMAGPMVHPQLVETSVMIQGFHLYILPSIMQQ
jgi:hypothetical protein